MSPDRSGLFPLDVAAVLFDLDGTLLDTVPLIVAAHRHALGLVHEPPEIWDDDRLRSTIGLPLEFVYDEAVYGERAAGLIEAFVDYNIKRTPFEVGMFLGLIPMLEGLRAKGILLGVVTAKRRAQTAFTLETFGLARFFDVVVVKEDTKRHKPFPDPLLEAARRLGVVDPARVLYVGDSVHDIESANNAGFYSAAVGWSRMPKDALEAARPTFWLDRAERLPSLLQAGQFAIMADELDAVRQKDNTLRGGAGLNGSREAVKKE